MLLRMLITCHGVFEIVSSDCVNENRATKLLFSDCATAPEFAKKKALQEVDVNFKHSIFAFNVDDVTG
jgi:hypothetical protein